MKLLTIECLVVHRAQRHAAQFSLRLGAVAINSRRGRHVETLRRADERRVMHLDKSTFVLVAEGGARGAVRLVADDKVEVGQTMALLGAADDVDRVVGAEDHAHVRGVVPFGHFGGQAGGLGSGRVT